MAVGNIRVGSAGGVADLPPQARAKLPGVTITKSWWLALIKI